MGTYMSPHSMQQIKDDRMRLMGWSRSDENAMMKQILATHTPDPDQVVDVKTILRHVEDIFKCTAGKNITIDSTKSSESPVEMEGPMLDSPRVELSESPGEMEGPMLDSPTVNINRISDEIQHRRWDACADTHETTFSLFNLEPTRKYSWDAKLVLTLRGFALFYGNLYLPTQTAQMNELAYLMAILKPSPVTLLQNSGPLKPWFDALNNLIKAMLDVTRCVVELMGLPSTSYNTEDDQAFSAANATIPIAVYWTIRSVVTCMTQITNPTDSECMSSREKAWSLSTLADKLNNINDHLQKQLAICKQHIDEKMKLEAFQKLQSLFEKVHFDNKKILEALIRAKDDLQPLFDGSTKEIVNLDVLRNKNVLLLISGLDIPSEELAILKQIHNETRPYATRLGSQYEVVWIPIPPTGQWTDPMPKQFESLQSTMPWYTVHRPFLIDQAVIRFIKEVWHFRNKPILVVLDPQGKVASPNALHMMWIWGSNAFPFTSLREEAMWREETWRLELLLNDMDTTIMKWIREGKYIFLYGGDDIEWIRKFTSTARAVSQAASIPLEMVYVGKSGKREQVRKVVTTINNEKLSYCWQDLTVIWYFWTRLESMLFSKIQQGRSIDQDPMLQEIKKLLSHDKNGGWALLSKGSGVVINGHGTTVLPALLEYDMWKERVPTMGFEVAFKDHHSKVHSVAVPCCRFEFLTTTAGRIPDDMKCPECLRIMEKFISFMCCHNENAMPGLY